jgi:methanogenic corrinoid protein MtbC1
VPPRLAERAARILPGGEYQRFLDLLMGSTPDDEVSDFLAEVLERGHSPQAVYSDLLAPAARQLGVMWEEDRCDFTQVTLACCQLQRVIRRLSSRLLASRGVESKGRAVVMGLSGTQHTLGILLVAEALSDEGWTVELGEPFQSPPDYRGVDLLAFSLSQTERWEDGRDLIASIRSKADPRLQVMVGGAAFLMDPSLTARMGADGWAEDVRSVGTLAERLCATARHADGILEAT